MRIESYSFGRIVIDGEEYTSDVIVYPDRVRAGWWRKEGHYLHMEDLLEVLQFMPEVLVIGTGASGAMRVPGDLIEELEGKGIMVIVERTKKACDVFNRLVDEGKRVVAALHLTC